MKRFFIAAACICMAVIPLFAQSKPTREVKMPTEGGLGTPTNDYVRYDQGFFCAAELSGAYSPSSTEKSVNFTEVDFVGGYRFNDYIRVGLGLGARLYIDSRSYRSMNHDWGMPLFLNARGNFIPNGYRSVVPFWSFDIGGAFPDGMMIRPTVGIRVGQPRSAFIASIGYVAQQIRHLKIMDGGPSVLEHNMRSFITLKVGYEF